jgi:hypothetical protein
VVTANKTRAYVFWYPQMREVRQMPQFKKIMRDAGFVCRRTQGEDFECT